MVNLLAHADSVYTSNNLVSSGDVSISWLAIALAVVAAMAIGTVWYGPLFGKKWMKLVGLKKNSSSPVTPMLMMLVLSILQAFILAHFIAHASSFYFDYSGLSVGLLTGMWAFLGFVMPVLVSNTIFANGSRELLKINLGNQLVTLLVIGAILGGVN
jgi:hypothetical protein